MKLTDKPLAATAALRDSIKKTPVMWALALLSLAPPFLTGSRYYQDIMALTLLWAGLSCAWNLYSGYSRRVSIGHAAFLGIGAYTSTLLYLKLGVSPWLGMLAGSAVSALAALLIGGLTLRLKGAFFVLSTIAFAKIMEVAAVTSKGLTGGSQGLTIHYDPSLANMIFASKSSYAALCWLYMMLCLLLCLWLERSRTGLLLTASGENQEAAESLGIHASAVMLAAFVLSAALTSMGGSIYAQYYLFMEPTSLMGLSSSVNFILLAITGGMGTAFGPVLGSMLLTPLSNLLRGGLTRVSGLHGFVLGLALLAVLIFKPDGILPQLRGFAAARLGRGGKRDA
ncbi:MAG: branched-chain amino acid ABC transporter permease [Clostridiales Family XIII bacterium]|jgi:branched-chain amino acid transport system permease protein|nr:branched-chain amino acid ABC transporter permease [Clostridiales Family XIII bacterium]